MSEGKWLLVKFCNIETLAWVPPRDLWGVLGKTPPPDEKHVLAQIDGDAPHRWLLPASLSGRTGLDLTCYSCGQPVIELGVYNFLCIKHGTPVRITEIREYEKLVEEERGLKNE